MGDYKDIKARVQEVIRPNGTGAITAADHQQLLLDIIDEIGEHEGSLQEEIQTLGEQTGEELARKANEDGKYPELTAGFANNLVGRGEAVDATINFRASGGTSIEDGAARVKELRGNSLVWNQKIPNGDFRDGLSSWDVQSKIVANVTNGVVEVTCSAAGDNYIQARNKKFITGHQYLFMGDAKISSANVVCFYIFYGTTSNLLSITSKSTEWESYYRFFKCQGTAYNLVRLQCPKTEVTHQYRNIQLVDLTQMFGEGNEPTTLEEFYSRIPQNVDLYAYNEGEVIHTNAEGIKSVGFNAWDEEWEKGNLNPYYGNNVVSDASIRSKNYIPIIGGQDYFVPSVVNYMLGYDRDKKFLRYLIWGDSNRVVTIGEDVAFVRIAMKEAYGATYNHDICINLAHSGYRNGEYQPYIQFIRDIDPRIREAFPNGMKSAGSASDKVYNKNGKGIIEKRIGKVKINDLTWSLYNIGTYGIKCFTATRPTNTFAYINASTYHGILSETFINKTWNEVYDAASESAVGLSISATKNEFRIVAPNCNDVETFLASYGESYIIYELAEPEILEFDEPFNLDYEVWDFGTEQMLSSEPSAPIKASIVYGFNAVDSIRTAQLEIEALKTQLAQMQTLMASMTAQPAE